jgi:DNA-binding PadR family transcriptional regulator
MHRYEMASVMRARGKDADRGIKWGSLYTVVQNLEKNGFVEAIATTRQGARPERTVYQITEAGRVELIDWVRELIADPQPERTRFVAGLSVLSLMSPPDIIDLLLRRLDRLTESITSQRGALAEAGAEVPRLFLIEDEYRIAMTRAEAAWVRSLLDELSGGTFPHPTSWRMWHESGDIPTEFAEVAQRGTGPEH